MELEFKYARMATRIFTGSCKEIVLIDGYPWPDAYEYNIDEGWAWGYCRTAYIKKLCTESDNTKYIKSYFIPCYDVGEEGSPKYIYFKRSGKIQLGILDMKTKEIKIK